MGFRRNFDEANRENFRLRLELHKIVKPRPGGRIPLDNDELTGNAMPVCLLEHAIYKELESFEHVPAVIIVPARNDEANATGRRHRRF
jgi:hypothetical protein